jgi:glycosyltransferase involved in cell wall biosynthesis
MFVLSSRVEGNPLSVMEAMAAGLPVVSTAVGGVPELVRDRETGLLVPSEDAEALAQAMQALVDDPVRRQAMGAVARQYAMAHFDIRHTVRGYEQLYESLLNRG